MFKVSNKNTRTTSMSLLLTLNIFHTLFQYFCSRQIFRPSPDLNEFVFIENMEIIWYVLLHLCIFFSVWVFFHEHSRITGLQEKGQGISLNPHYHFHPLHRHLHISRAITADSSRLHIDSSQTRTGTFDFRVQVANH